jgi:hypothetical protein
MAMNVQFRLIGDLSKDRSRCRFHILFAGLIQRTEAL